MQIKKILLTTDFSDCSRRAFAPTADLARRFGAELDVVHVAEFPPPGGVEVLGVTLEEIHRGFGRQLEDLRDDPSFQGLEITTHLLEGYGPDAIRDFQEKGGHDLVSIASHGHTGFKHFILGSFAERVLRTATCPVLVMRVDEGRDSFQARKILFPCDFSDESRAAVPAVRFFATSFKAKVVVFHALHRDLIPAIAYVEGAAFAKELPRFWEDAEKWARRELDALISKEFSDVEAGAEIATGAPVVEISRKAKELKADLVIMATHGRTGISHALLGSVAERVVREAPCSTITVRPPAEPRKDE